MPKDMNVENKVIFIEGRIIVANRVSISESGRLTGYKIGYGVRDSLTREISYHQTEETHFYAGTSWFMEPFKGKFSD